MAKSIILFSDGTGNSSAKLFKTNVWRMYEAVDLGPSSRRQARSDLVLRRRRRHVVVQAADAAGRRLRLGSAAQRSRHLSLRLPQLPERRRHLRLRVQPRRVHDTPRRRADRVGGTRPSTSEAELDRKSREAYRRFRAAFLPRRLKWPTKLVRARARLDRPPDRATQGPRAVRSRRELLAQDPLRRRLGHGRRRMAGRSPRSRERSTTGSFRSACRTTS